MRKRARTDLRGGRSARIVPTATRIGPQPVSIDAQQSHFSIHSHSVGEMKSARPAIGAGEKGLEHVADKKRASGCHVFDHGCQLQF
jgi:hypothetical protein